MIIKDHHEPIVSRELFEEANRILDERSLSQEGKAKHSNRYPFSVKSNADIAAQAMWQDIKPEKTAANIRRGGVRKRQSTEAPILTKREIKSAARGKHTQ